MTDVTVSREIAASPDAVWALLSDLPRMPEWSPENEAVEWLGGASAAAPGARFRGTNRVGPRSWKTVAEVTAAEPGRRLAFRVKAGPFPVADWSYEIEATDGGCRVAEGWTDRRGHLFAALTRVVTGVGDRASHNRRGMEETLRRLAAAAEAPAAG